MVYLLGIIVVITRHYFESFWKKLDDINPCDRYMYQIIWNYFIIIHQSANHKDILNLIMRWRIYFDIFKICIMNFYFFKIKIKNKIIVNASGCLSDKFCDFFLLIRFIFFMCIFFMRIALFKKKQKTFV